MEGLTAIISIKVADPQFEGQTKGKLGNREVQRCVHAVVKEKMKEFLDRNPKEAKARIRISAANDEIRRHPDGKGRRKHQHCGN